MMKYPSLTLIFLFMLLPYAIKSTDEDDGECSWVDSNLNHYLEKYGELACQANESVLMNSLLRIPRSTDNNPQQEDSEVLNSPWSFLSKKIEENPDAIQEYLRNRLTKMPTKTTLKKLWNHDKTKSTVGIIPTSNVKTTSKYKQKTSDITKRSTTQFQANTKSESVATPGFEASTESSVYPSIAHSSYAHQEEYSSTSLTPKDERESINFNYPKQSNTIPDEEIKKNSDFETKTTEEDLVTSEKNVKTLDSELISNIDQSYDSTYSTESLTSIYSPTFINTTPFDDTSESSVTIEQLETSTTCEEDLSTSTMRTLYQTVPIKVTIEQLETSTTCEEDLSTSTMRTFYQTVPYDIVDNNNTMLKDLSTEPPSTFWTEKSISNMLEYSINNNILNQIKISEEPEVYKYENKTDLNEETTQTTEPFVLSTKSFIESTTDESNIENNIINLNTNNSYSHDELTTSNPCLIEPIVCKNNTKNLKRHDDELLAITAKLKLLALGFIELGNILLQDNPNTICPIIPLKSANEKNRTYPPTKYTL